MTRNSKIPQFCLEHLGIVVLVLTIFVLPTLQSVTRDWFSPGWDIATYVILGVGLVALTLLPWLRARPLQKLLNERLLRNAEDFGLIVTLWGADSKPSELVVLMANRDGLEFLTPHYRPGRIR